MSLVESVADLCTIAYFSMEVGFDPAVPTYSGGLGILAGDFLRAAADMGIQMVGVSLLHRRGYFRQSLDDSGYQTESASVWNPSELLEEMPARVAVSLEGRTVLVRSWRYLIQGVAGEAVPLYLLDTDLPENTPWDRTLTDSLYGGDTHYRLCQEALLGFAGVAMLRAVGHDDVHVFHVPDQLDHQRRSRGNLDVRAGCPPLRSAPAGVAEGQLLPPLRDWHPPRRDPAGSRRGEARPHRRGPAAGRRSIRCERDAR